jgi:hypothetical protein
MPRNLGLARNAKALFATALLVASFVILSVAAPALATPKGAFSVFAECPVTHQ